MKILIVYGGVGSENTVSKMGTKNVRKMFTKTDYSIDECEIFCDGKWEKSWDEIAKYDAIFPLVHGRGGEDGAIAALGEIMKVPVIGCGMAASAVAWDKDFTKILAEKNKIPVVPWKTLYTENEENFAKICAELDTEKLFIKPAREGSSFGAGIAKNAEEFREKVAEASKYDNKILIEKAIEKPRELEVAVLGNSLDLSKIFAVGPGEICSPETGFYSYGEKYSEDSRTKLAIPANNLPNEIREKILDFAKKIFVAIGGNGLARVDFFLDKNGEIFLNEVNTMPGFTDRSMWPMLMRTTGLNDAEIMNRLVKSAFEWRKNA